MIIRRAKRTDFCAWKSIVYRSTSWHSGEKRVQHSSCKVPDTLPGTVYETWIYWSTNKLSMRHMNHITTRSSQPHGALPPRLFECCSLNTPVTSLDWSVGTMLLRAYGTGGGVFGSNISWPTGLLISATPTVHRVHIVQYSSILKGAWNINKASPHFCFREPGKGR